MKGMRGYPRRDARLPRRGKLRFGFSARSPSLRSGTMAARRKRPCSDNPRMPTVSIEEKMNPAPACRGWVNCLAGNAWNIHIQNNCSEGGGLPERLTKVFAGGIWRAPKFCSWGWGLGGPIPFPIYWHAPARNLGCQMTGPAKISPPPALASLFI